MTQPNQNANPYNSTKEWHSESEDNRVTESADSLFHPPKQTEKKEESVKDDPTSTDKSEQNHDWKKRYDGLRSDYDRVVLELKELKGRKEEPVVTDPVETKAEDKTETKSERSEDPDQRVADVERQLAEIQKERSELTKQKAKETIRKAHPDFGDIVDSDEFHEWAKSKSKIIQDAIYNNPNDAQSAIEVLDLYKFESDNKKSEEEASQRQSKNQEDASSIIPSRNLSGSVESREKIWTVSEIRQLKGKQLEQALPEINRAQQEGRIVNK